MSIKKIVTLSLLIALTKPYYLNGQSNVDNQPTRLRITNQCKHPIWMGHLNITDPRDRQNIKLDTGQSHDYHIPDQRTEATRFWPKTGCDESGNNCTLGQSMEPCPENGCHPPVESKFEATWAATTCSPEQPGAECLTWYNASLVDGWTIPFDIQVKGPDAQKRNCVSVNSSKLDLNNCPDNEDLSGGGEYPEYKNVNLRIYDPKDKNKIIGCMAPCKKLNYSAPWGLGLKETNDPALHMCCPTDPDKLKHNNCTWSESCATSESCRNKNDPLSVEHTQYVKRLHQMAPDQYAFSYDDANGLHQCSARTQFHLTFCPLELTDSMADSMANNMTDSMADSTMDNMTDSMADNMTDKEHEKNVKIMPIITPETQELKTPDVQKPQQEIPLTPQKSRKESNTINTATVTSEYGVCSDRQTRCAGCQCCPDGTLCPGAQGCPTGLCPND